jgi:hypothetical protein
VRKQRGHGREGTRKSREIAAEEEADMVIVDLERGPVILRCSS